jgi:hypothetical protein
VHVEIAVAPPHGGAGRVRQQERVRRRSGAPTYRNTIVVIDIIGVEIFQTDREILGDLDFGTATIAVAPTFGSAIIGKAVRGVAGFKFIFDFSVGNAARSVIQFPCKIVESGSRAERTHAVARFIFTGLDKNTINNVAVLLIITGANIIFEPI